MSARVFMPAWTSKFDSGPAEKFGEIIYLMKGESIVNPFNTERLISSFDASLDEHKFNPEVDFIALTGGHIFVSFLLATAAVSYDRLKLLLFDASNERYVERPFFIEQTEPSTGEETVA